VWFSDRAAVTRDSDGYPRYLQGVMLDITERKQIEAQFVQAQKMQAVGQLAAGVAHDFNNILTAISGYSDLLLSQLAVDDPVRPHAQEIERAAYRAARLTRQLLAFSRRQVLEPHVLDLKAVVTEMVNMLQRLVGENINVRVTLAEHLGHIRADPGQIEQVIMNLAVNSRDAMPNGGTLAIQTANAALGPEECAELGELTAGDYVMLAVTDTGIGMSAEVKARVFEPFFTTKELGKGTGLGLATCYGIVRQSGGQMSVHSEPGQGTTFKIYLPHVNEPVSLREKVRASSVVPRGIETLLLVEDDQTVRSLAAFILRNLGYTVVEANNGEEALQEMQQHNGHQIHLVITDLVMPRMGGQQLADSLKRASHGIKVLFTSGFTEDAMAHPGVLGNGAFLQKPYTPGALARKVREVLDRSPTAPPS